LEGDDGPATQIKTSASKDDPAGGQSIAVRSIRKRRRIKREPSGVVIEFRLQLLLFYPHGVFYFLSISRRLHLAVPKMM
jgi:hypothetical protein